MSGAGPVFRVKKLKSLSAISGVSRHASRTIPTPNANSSLTKNNEWIGNPDLVEGVKKELKKVDGKIRADQVLAMEFLLSVGPRFFRKKTEPPGKWTQKKLNNFKKMANKFIAENLKKKGLN